MKLNITYAIWSCTKSEGFITDVYCCEYVISQLFVADFHYFLCQLTNVLFTSIRLLNCIIFSNIQG